MTAQAATIMGLVLQRARRRAAEASAYELAGRLIGVQENERRAIAGKLHDELGQDLLVIASQAQLSLSQPENPPATVQRLNEIAQTARQAIQQARHMAHNLRPGLLDELGLTKAIRATADKAGQAAGLSMAVTLADVDGLLPPEFEVNLFRIIQETLNNVLKHAGASQAKVTLTRERAHLRLVVEDDGRGFDASRLASLAPDQRGLGLREIAERARMMRGRAVIQSRPGQGTRVTVEVPTSRTEQRTIIPTTPNHAPFPSITVLIADDHPIFRRGLCDIIAGDPTLRLVGEAGDGEQAWRLDPETPADRSGVGHSHAQAQRDPDRPAACRSSDCPSS